jgi:uncharacterized protein
MDGHLSVEAANISKAMVCPYWGREIPDYQALGLDPEKIYQLYRDPAELERAAPTFHLKPLLIVHKAVSAQEPAQELIAGTVGAAEWNPPYLTAPLAVWTAEARELVEKGKKEQLSAGYRYKAVMTPGYADGAYYDGKMTQLYANHVALVVEGRCGPDVVIPDEMPAELKMDAKLAEALKPFLAKDADIAKLNTVFDAAMKDCEAEDESDDDEKDKEKAKDKRAKDKKAKDKKAKDEAEKKDDDEAEDEEVDHRKDFESEKDKGKDSKAKDSAITQDQLEAAVAAGVKLARDQMSDLHEARREVEPLVGVCALDSGDAVRKFALDHLKIDTKDVPAAAYKALLALAKQKAAPAPRMGFDAAASANAATIWPGLAQTH